MRRITRGFTIIELLVVVAVIGILATITLVGFNRYQADSRDAQRSSQATVIAEALEKYYDKNGEYPSCSTMTATGSSVIDNTLVGTDAEILVAPQAASDVTNSINLCTALTIGYATDSFAYLGDGSTTCSTGSSCLTYTLQYKEESTNTIKSIASRRTTDILTSSTITDLAATTYSFSQVNLAWGAVSGAASYNIQWKLNSNNFTTPTGTSTSSTSSASVTGLTLGSLYYFRVQPVSSTSATGSWSNIDSDTTFTLDTPVPTCIPVPASPASQLQCTWGAIANATSYTMQYSTASAVAPITGDFTTAPTNVTSATSPFILTGLSAGATRYFHVKSVAAGLTSGWSTTLSATTVPPAPVCSATAGSSNTQIVPDWDFSSGATSYTVQYGPSNYATEITGITGSYTTINGLNNGTTYTSRVKAVAGTAESAWTNCPNRTTGVDTPATPGVGVAMGGIRAYSSGRWIWWDPTDSPSGNWYYAQGWASTSCGSGASPQYLMGANYNSPSTFRGWTGWDSDSNYYMVRPYSGYSIRFTSIARCVSAEGVASGNSGQGYSGYLGP
jgi:prepilin-type N-terminal cleavage/methylation domain-containing protein